MSLDKSAHEAIASEREYVDYVVRQLNEAREGWGLPPLHSRHDFHHLKRCGFDP